jgi:chromate transporter
MRPALDVFLTFLRLGLTSFGGPTAHIGYFREELVVRRRWVDDPTFTDLVALSQFLPGPASSQVGFSLGLLRAGYFGGLAAWLGFTLPSAVLMTAFAFGAGVIDGPVGDGLLHGLKLVAVAIVAQAVWGMARSLCPDLRRASIGALVAAMALWSSSSLIQLAAILLGAILGLLLCRPHPSVAVGAVGVPVSRPVGLVALGVFALLLAGMPLLAGSPILAGSPSIGSARPWSGVALFDAFYRSGALVFGGGHVVLPLLRDAVVSPGWVGESTFLAGYGAAQAVPGPLFTFAAYLGAIAAPSQRVVGAAIALVAIFLPGILLLIGTLPFWDALRTRSGAQAVMRGINAAVVGLLGAALYSPLWTSAVADARDASVAIVGFLLLTVWRTAPIFVVAVGGVVGIGLSLLQR